MKKRSFKLFSDETEEVQESKHFKVQQEESFPTRSGIFVNLDPIILMESVQKFSYLRFALFSLVIFIDVFLEFPITIFFSTRPKSEMQRLWLQDKEDLLKVLKKGKRDVRATRSIVVPTTNFLYFLTIVNPTIA